MALSAADFAALSPLQQQAYLNGDPNYASAGPAAPTVQQTQTAELSQLTASENFVTLPFGTSMETVWTLDSYLSQWAAGSIAEPASLAGQDPMTAAAAVAADRCASIPTPDCANVSQLAARYGAQVAAAWAASGYGAPAVSPAAAPAPAAAAAAPSLAGPPSATPSGGMTAALAPAAPVLSAASAGPAPGVSPPGQGSLAPHFALSGDGGAVGGVLSTTVSTALAFVNPIIGMLSALVGILFSGDSLAKLANAVKQLSEEVTNLGDSLTRFTWSTANGEGAIWQADAFNWDNFFDSFWSSFKSVWKAVWTAVATVLPKIIQAMKDVRKFLDQIYAKYILKILRYLQLARGWLGILKALHIGWATKLDKILTQIQGALFTPFLYLMRIVNLHGAWYNVILAWDLTMQRAVFLRTMQKYQGDWINMWWTAQTGAGQAGTGSLPSTAAAPPSVQQGMADFRAYALTGAGPYADSVAQARIDWAQMRVGP